MKPNLRRPLGIAAIIAFAILCGGLTAGGHAPIAIALIAGAAAYAAVMSIGMRKRDLQAGRRLAEVQAESRRLQRRMTEAGRKLVARDQRLAERDRRLVKRVEHMERRLLASFEAERLRAAQRHREEMKVISEHTRGPSEPSRT